jgi:hypothetical protein
VECEWLFCDYHFAQVGEYDMGESGFTRLPSSLLELGPSQSLFEHVANAIRQQVEHPLFTIDVARVGAVPPEAQTVYWLWLFKCEARCNGIEVFILEPLGIYAREMHQALRTVGASELVRRVEAAIALARQGPAEFKTLADQSWFNQFTQSLGFPTLQSVDAGVYPIIRALNGLVEEFIRSHSEALFEWPHGEKDEEGRAQKARDANE